jgi:glycosyl transferase family 25
MSSLFGAFDRVRVVSLPVRQDRRRSIARQLKGFTFEFFDAYRVSEPGPFYKAGSFGAYLSHLQILGEAALRDESVLILQDDCVFRPDAYEYQVPPCDIFYGSHGADEDCLIGAHCMGFSASAAKLAKDYLLKLLDPAFPADPVAQGEPGFDPMIRPPIDGALVWFRRAHPELKTAFALLADQRRSKSDVSPGALDRVPVVREAARFTRWLFPKAFEEKPNGAG